MPESMYNQVTEEEEKFLVCYHLINDIVNENFR